MESVYIIDSLRLPIGKYGGQFAHISLDELGGYGLEKLINKNPTLISKVDGILLGNIVGGGGNVARRVALKACLPLMIPATTIDYQCGSGLASVVFAQSLLRSGEANYLLCGGVESTSQAPWQIERPAKLFGKPPIIRQRAALSTMELGDLDMGIACEQLVRRFNISREEQDQFALSSQKKYNDAQKIQSFKKEITPFQEITIDESPRATANSKDLAKLSPVFEENGTITAGNSCPLNDGAAFLGLASKTFCEENNLFPQFELIGSSLVGVHPKDFGLAPVFAVQKLLEKYCYSLDEIDRISLNESFAVQALACIRLGGWPIEKINVSGGAIAFGHPFGATGAILLHRLMTELKQVPTLRLGVVTMCVGGGQGIAILIKKVRM